MALPFILLNIFLTVMGQILIKQGLVEIGENPIYLAQLPSFLIHVLFTWKVALGLLCAVGAAMSWIIAISRTDLSFAYPFTALGIVLILLLSGLLFGEAVPITRWLGVGIVIVGIIVASRS